MNTNGVEFFEGFPAELENKINDWLDRRNVEVVAVEHTPCGERAGGVPKLIAAVYYRDLSMVAGR